MHLKASILQLLFIEKILFSLWNLNSPFIYTRTDVNFSIQVGRLHKEETENNLTYVLVKACVPD